jgi:integrase
VGSVRKKDTGRKPYEARYRDEQGRSRSKSFRTVKEARGFIARVETDLARGTFIDPRLGRTPFGEWARGCLDGRINLRPATRAKNEVVYRNQIAPYFADAPLSGIRKEHIQSWVAKLAERYAPASIRQSYALLGSIFAEAVDARLIAENPCRKVKLPKLKRLERRFLRADEVEHLAGAIDSRYRPLVHTAAYLGCRWEELAGLKRNHLDLLREKVLIVGVIERTASGSYAYAEETKSTSGRRTLELPAFLVEIFAEHLAAAPESEWVFPAPGGGFLRYDNFRVRIWNPAVKRANLAPLTFHALRHTCAALLIDQGADPLAVQRRLGHSDIKTTLGLYGHRFPNREAALNDALEGVFRSAQRPSVGYTWDSPSDGEVVELSFGAEK